MLSAAPLPATKEFTNSLGMRFTRIEAGAFTMGETQEMPPALLDPLTYPTRSELTGRFPEIDPAKFRLPTEAAAHGDYDERPVHRAALSQAYYLGTCEVTNAQFEQFLPAHRALRGKHGFSQADDEAVVFVTWAQAVAFCEWLSQKEQRPYRLPTETEWEYAARAGTTTLFSTGNTLPAPFLKNARSTAFTDPQDSVSLAVGMTPPNPWGLFDMHGNVEEWVADWYGPYQSGDQVDPSGPTDGDFRVTRGGSHGVDPYYLRSANRLGALPETASWLIGFRVALGPPVAHPGSQPAPPAVGSRPAMPPTPPRFSPAADASAPYFAGPRCYVKIPAGSNGPLFSQHNHDAAITDCPNGDLLAIWYTCVQERGREVAIAAARLRRGADEWEPAYSFWDTPDHNDHCPALWYDGMDTMYHFNGVGVAGRWEPLAIIMRTSRDSGITWSKARYIVPDFGLRNMVGEPVLQTRDGSILFGADAAGGSTIWISRDRGETWNEPGGNIKGIHAGIVELNDARLMALGRGQNIDGWMPMSLSSDHGVTWQAKASALSPIGGGQRVALIRLKEGPLFFASFARDVTQLEPMASPARDQRGETSLFGALSFDDGKTWPVRRVITDGLPEHSATTIDGGRIRMSPNSSEPQGYLSVCQARDGVIHLISSINHYAFNAAWVKLGQPEAPRGAQRQRLPVRKSLADRYARAPAVLNEVSLEKGFTVEARGGIGFELELVVPEGTLITNRYFLRIAADGIYYRRAGEFLKIADSSAAAEPHRYRLAVRDDTAVQIYRDGQLLTVETADVQPDWRLPARGPILSWKNSVETPTGDGSGAYQPN